MALPSTGYATATITNPSASLTDFTAIVDLSKMPPDWWSAVDTTDATKGRAAIDSGPTEVPADWIAFDSVNETGWVRVKWSGTLSSSGTKKIRIYPPQSGNSSYAASDTYGQHNAYRSNWTSYHTLDADPTGTAPQYLDRTGNNYDANAINDTTRVSGQIVDAAHTDQQDPSFDTGTESGQEGVEVPAGSYEPFTASDSLTLSSWLRVTALTSDSDDFTNEVINWWDANAGDGMAISLGGGDVVSEGIPFVYTSGGNTRSTANSNGTAVNDGNWHHIVAVWDQSAATIAVYIDGELDYSVSSYGDTSSAAASEVQLRVGTGPENVDTIGGDHDEANAFKEALSAAYVGHEYDQINDQGSFWNLAGGTWTWNAVSGSGFQPAWAAHANQHIGLGSAA